MALETLVSTSVIGGFGVDDICLKQLTSAFPIAIDHDSNIIAFKIQNGPVKHFGVNGCQVVTMIEAVKLIIEKLNDKFPSVENRETIGYLQDAITCQNNRTANREFRGVEGTNQI